MKAFRSSPPESFTRIAVNSIEDYVADTKTRTDGTIVQLTLPQSDVLKFLLEGESWVCIRPSGTETKCKIYIEVKKDNAEEAERTSATLVDDFMRLIK